MDEGGFDGGDSPDASPSGAATSCSCLTMIVVKKPRPVPLRDSNIFLSSKRTLTRPASVPAEVGKAGGGKKKKTKQNKKWIFLSVHKGQRGKKK